jgi:hypothetical protein
VLSYNKAYYGTEDVEIFRRLISIINKTFPERGARSMKKQMLSSKEKEVWTCECGKSNDIGQRCSSCEKDIYGFRSTEVNPSQAITNIEERIDLIMELVKA